MIAVFSVKACKHGVPEAYTFWQPMYSFNLVIADPCSSRTANSRQS